MFRPLTPPYPPLTRTAPQMRQLLETLHKMHMEKTKAMTQGK